MIRTYPGIIAVGCLTRHLALQLLSNKRFCVSPDYNTLVKLAITVGTPEYSASILRLRSKSQVRS